ncbi:hypothetical protein V6N13_129479 [Hibiscus sabdariffa]
MEKHDFDNIIANDPYAYAPRLSVTIGGIGYGRMSFLQSSGAFEVFCNGELFSGEIELKDLVNKTLANSRVTDNLGVVWS